MICHVFASKSCGKTESEITPNSNNGYDITISFCCFEKFLANTLFLPSFITVRLQRRQLDWGEGDFLSSPQSKEC